MGNTSIAEWKLSIPDLKRKLGSLWLVSKYINKEAQLKLANGIIISKIIHMISIWGSTRPSWINWVQRIQNKAAHYVLKSNRYTKISKLPLECNWLSVNQRNTYHSVILLRKVWYSQALSVLRNGLRMNIYGRF